MEDRFIEALNEIKEANIRDEQSLQVWQSKAINLIIRIYGSNSKQEEQINSIKFRLYITSTELSTSNNSKKKSIISKLTSFGSGLASNVLANILTNPGLYS